MSCGPGSRRRSTTGWRPTSQQAFATAYADDPDIYVPQVVQATDHVLITEWMDGTPLARVIEDGTQEERNRAGILFTRFLFSGPARAGLLHADPHPGNFRMLADGRLGVLDFGAVDRLPDGLPPFIGKLLRIIHTDGDIREAEDELREQGFVRPGIDVDLDALYAFLAPLAEPSRLDTFKFSREWLRSEAARVTDPRSSSLGRRLNLPPSYVLIHRVSTEGIGVLCQLGSEGPFRAELIRWMPGYATDGTAPGQPGPDGTSLRTHQPRRHSLDGTASTAQASTAPAPTAPAPTAPGPTAQARTALA